MIVAEAIGAHGGHARGHALMESHGHAEVLDRLPEWVEDGLVPVETGARRVGSKKDRLEAQLGHGPTRLTDRGRDVLDREHGRSVHPPGITGLTEVGQPVVVGARDGRRKGRVHVRIAVHEESPRRVEDGDVDALSVHGAQMGHGVEATLDVCGKAIETPRKRYPRDPS